MQRLLILILSLAFAVIINAADVTKSTIEVKGMTCDACVEKVTTALQQVEGVEKVSVDLESGLATVEHNGVELVSLNSAIVKAGFNTESSGLKKYECDEIKEKTCFGGNMEKCCSQGKSVKKEI